MSLLLLALFVADAQAQQPRTTARTAARAPAKASIFSNDYVSAVSPNCKDGSADKNLRTSEPATTTPGRQQSNPDKAK